MSFKWRKEFSVNNSQVDLQHQKIFEMADVAKRLAIKMDNGDVEEHKEELTKLVKDLIAYVKTHFQEEERLMYAIKFPRLKTHKKMHSELLRDVKQVLNNLDDLKHVVRQLSKILPEWIFFHIINEDILIKNSQNKALDIKEIHYGLDEYFELVQFIKQDLEEVDFKYTCMCGKTHKVNKFLHEQMLKENSFIRCKNCKQALVWLDPSMINEKMFNQLEKKVFNTR